MAAAHATCGVTAQHGTAFGESEKTRCAPHLTARCQGVQSRAKCSPRCEAQRRGTGVGCMGPHHHFNKLPINLKLFQHCKIIKNKSCQFYLAHRPDFTVNHLATSGYRRGDCGRERVVPQVLLSSPAPPPPETPGVAQCSLPLNCHCPLQPGAGCISWERTSPSVLPADPRAGAEQGSVGAVRPRWPTPGPVAQLRGRKSQAPAPSRGPFKSSNVSQGRLCCLSFDC